MLMRRMLQIDANLIRGYPLDPPHPRSIPMSPSCVVRFNSVEAYRLKMSLLTENLNAISQPAL